MSKTLLLSKSDYKTARECPGKLYYRKLEYQSTKEGDDYLDLLAKGGYMIGAIASLLFPGAISVSETNNDKAIQITQELLQNTNVTFLEAAFVSKGKFAKPDILIKDGNHLTLIEVKAKSFDSSKPSPFRNKNGTIKLDCMPYLEDVAFQALILKELYPEAQLTCELMMPDITLTTSIDNLHSFFELKEIAKEESGSPHARVTFTGDVEQLRASHFLARVNVSREVDELIPSVSAYAERFCQSLNPLTRIPGTLSFSCKDCEYRLEEEGTPDGFSICWGNAATPKPHILDLYFGGTISEVDTLISTGRTSLFDLPEAALIKKDGSVGARNQRQLIQIRNTKNNVEWIDPALVSILDSHAYPLHFIDFETSALAVPYHAGMHPYENVAFQWSCHTIPAPGREPVHAEWINLEESFPNFAFAESLRKHLGQDGTVFMWATHENTILRDILRQMEGKFDNPTLKDWLTWMISLHMVDMNQLTLNYYFHPLMKGKTSIKKVLDAVWQINPALRERFPSYIKEEKGKLLSPYKALPPLLIDGKDVFVREGTGAITAYQAMLYGPQKSDRNIRDQWMHLLLQYCELDTLAMVMIYSHWKEKLVENRRYK